MAKRRHFRYDCDPGCAAEATVSLIDGKWKGVILHALLAGRLRFRELRRLLPGAGERMLTAQLRELERDGLVVRTAHPGVPPRVEYALSELGGTLEPVLYSLEDWARDHLDLGGRRPAG